MFLIMRSFTRATAILLLFIGAISTGCQTEPEEIELTYLDSALNDLLAVSSNGIGASHYRLPQSDDFANIPQDPNNPISPSKVELGRMLFHETVIGNEAKNASGMGTYSCASCHHAAGGFQACLPQGLGDGGVGFGTTGEGRFHSADYALEDIDVQPVRTPSALNIAYQSNVLWNGQFGANGVNVGTESKWTPETPIAKNFLGFDGAEIQAIAGLDVHRMLVDTSLTNQYPVYEELFNEAFADFPEEERVSNITAGLAIAAYERTLLPNQAPFQRWLNGDHSAMSQDQKVGAILFFGKGKCSSCHDGPALSSMEFHALGMNDLHLSPEAINVEADNEARLGRASFTKNPMDRFKFKVPQLYNLKDSPFYGHGASFTSVKDVIDYKNNAEAENPNVSSTQLADDFEPLFLTDEEVAKMADFIDNALRDGHLDRFNPESLPSGQCFPNNDEVSKEDMGCE